MRIAGEDAMRRLLSLQASQALFATAPRTLIVVGAWLAYVFAAAWIGPFISGWLVILVGLLLFVFTIYLGAAWLDRDILRESRRQSEDG
jgi:hypothetical protein